MVGRWGGGETVQDFLLKDLEVFPLVNVAVGKCSLYSCPVNFKQLAHEAKLWHAVPVIFT